MPLVHRRLGLSKAYAKLNSKPGAQALCILVLSGNVGVAIRQFGFAQDRHEYNLVGSVIWLRPLINKPLTRFLQLLSGLTCLISVLLILAIWQASKIFQVTGLQLYMQFVSAGVTPQQWREEHCIPCSMHPTQVVATLRV